MRVEGVEPPHLAVPDFESGASTNSATPAYFFYAFGLPIAARMAYRIHAAANHCLSAKSWTPLRSQSADFWSWFRATCAARRIAPNAAMRFLCRSSSTPRQYGGIFTLIGRSSGAVLISCSTSSGIMPLDSR